MRSDVKAAGAIGSQPGFQGLVAGELETRDHDDLVGLAAHVGTEGAKRARRHGDGLGAAVQRAVARALHDFGVQHPAVVVDGDDHGQLAIELLAAEFGEVLGALVFDLAAQGVVVHGVHLLAGRRADVALLGAGVFFVDAPLDLGQHLDQLAAPFFLRGLCCVLAGLARVGRGQGGNLLAQLGQQQGLLLVHGVAVLRWVFLEVVAHAGQGRVGQRAGGAALLGVATARQRGLGNGLGLGRAPRWCGR